jgi:glycerophosphoryl diester phosphodiesterase
MPDESAQMSHRRPLVLGHRGASAHAADNTIAAYRLALEHGADGIECDVRRTADDVIVMHHDPVIDGMGVLGGYPFAALRQRHPHIPTLDETLAALPEPGFVLNIEIKNDPDEPGFDPDHRLGTAIATWVGHHQLHDRIVISSFNRAIIDRVRESDDAISTGLLLGHQRFTPLLAGIASDGHRWVLPHHSRLLFGARRHIEKAHETGLYVGTWTLDSPWRLRRVRFAHIDAVISNDPGAAIRRMR